MSEAGRGFEAFSGLRPALARGRRDRRKASRGLSPLFRELTSSTGRNESQPLLRARQIQRICEERFCRAIIRVCVAAHLPTRGWPCPAPGHAHSPAGVVRSLGCPADCAGERYGTQRCGLVCGRGAGADSGKATALRSGARGLEEMLQPSESNPAGIAPRRDRPPRVNRKPASSSAQNLILSVNSRWKRQRWARRRAPVVPADFHIHRRGVSCPPIVCSAHSRALPSPLY